MNIKRKNSVMWRPFKQRFPEKKCMAKGQPRRGGKGCSGLLHFLGCFVSLTNASQAASFS